MKFKSKLTTYAMTLAILCAMALATPALSFAAAGGVVVDASDAAGSATSTAADSSAVASNAAASGANEGLHYVGDGSKPVIGASLITFGFYPQTEIVASESQSGVYGKVWANGGSSNAASDNVNSSNANAGGGWLVDPGLYEILASEETIYDENGDTVIDGCKYRRILEQDAVVSIDASSYYNWADPETYHYFKYEPIEWQILAKSSDGKEAFLLSRQALDDYQYNSNYKNTTWETSPMRSWLNGSQQGDFKATAFVPEEIAAINTANLANDPNPETNTDGGVDTQDKIFLLAESDLYGNNGVINGFNSKKTIVDTARQATSTTYAKAKGVWSSTSDNIQGKCSWWLRSPGYYTNSAACVKSDGSVYSEGQNVDEKNVAVRPAIKLDLTQTEAFGVKADISKIPTITYFTISENQYNFNGKARTPSVTVAGLTEGIDFKVSYKNNIEPGTASVFVTGIGDWQGTISQNFTIQYEPVAEGSLKRVLSNDCIYFGSYPKREIVYNKTAALTYGKAWDNLGKYYIVDSSLYNKLMKANWSSKSNATIDGVKYKRAKYYDGKYHYFKYEKIKWRILRKTSTSYLVVADECLDCEPYHYKDVKVSWAKSDIRAWLNDEFINAAFTSTQQKALKNSQGAGCKVFLLALENVFKEKALDYGFEQEGETEFCEVYPERVSGFTSYAYSKGIDARPGGSACWWLRDDISWIADASSAAYVNQYGGVYDWDHTGVADFRIGVRPALILSREDGRTYTSAGNTGVFKTLDLDCMLTCFDVYPLTDGETCPKVTISGLKEGRDFEVNYLNNNELGVGTIVVSGIGNYTGTMKKSFLIFKQVSLSGMKMKLSAEEVNYLGKACKPKVTIDGLTEGVDFKVVYTNNNEVGMATATAKGINGWTGSISKTFAIKKVYDITKKTAKLSKTSYIYSGGQKKPTVSITGLTKGEDYTVTYKNNVKVGTATAVITGMGEYVGTIKKSFKILPKGTSIKSLTPASKSFTARWYRQSTQTSGYQIRYSRNADMSSAHAVKITSPTTAARKINDLKSKTKYYLQIRTYKVAGGLTYYSSWSSKKYVITK